MAIGDGAQKGKLAAMLRMARRGELPDGWLYLPDEKLSPQTDCLFLPSDEHEPEDREEYVASIGFPDEGLDNNEMKTIVEGVERLTAAPSDAQLVRAFDYYLMFDAYLPELDAPDPPEIKTAKDNPVLRQFYESLGPERDAVPCRADGCTRGAVALSVLCRRHHYESVFFGGGQPCPFED
jgi:hypothetical protein